MCQAIEDMKKETVEQGIKVSKYLMKNYTQQKTKKDIINELVNEFNISTDDAKMYLDDFLS